MELQVAHFDAVKQVAQLYRHSEQVAEPLTAYSPSLHKQAPLLRVRLVWQPVQLEELSHEVHYTGHASHNVPF